MKRYAIGVDVGGSHISCKIYDLIEGLLLDNSFTSVDLNNSGSKEEILNTFVELLQPVLKKINKEELAGIGFAMPGPFDYLNGIALFAGENAKFDQLNQVNIKQELSERLALADVNIRFINDATAFALGEFFNGMLKGSSNSLAITLGTGFGSAFLSKGIPVITENTVPYQGCLWHLKFEEGIADDYFSTRGLVSRFENESGLKIKGAKEISDLYEQNEFARNVFHDFGAKLAHFLSPWIKSFGIERIVIGGNISKAYTLFNDALQQNLNTKIEVNSSQLLEDSAFIGAAVLLNDEFYDSIHVQLKHM